MSSLREYSAGRRFVFRLPPGSDLLQSIQAFCQERSIAVASFQLIGAVRSARIAFYDQGHKRYGELAIDRAMEIVSCSGNVSLRDGQPFVHAHISLADEEGHSLGGHLLPGTIVFVAEVDVQELRGEPLLRTPDQETGLPLWKIEP